MNESNVERFFDLYYGDEALRKRIADAEAAYPGSLEIRDAVVKDILLPIAQELGLPFTLLELKVYETRRNAELHQDVEQTEEELARWYCDESFWLVDRGWETDTDVFKEAEERNKAQ